MLAGRLARAAELAQQREATALQLSLAKSREQIVVDASEREDANLAALERSMAAAGMHVAWLGI